jgi:hypothetical protein
MSEILQPTTTEIDEFEARRARSELTKAFDVTGYI